MLSRHLIVVSRLANESKYFDELPNAPVTNNRYDIGYTYNLAGGLETITDPFGYTVTYSHDSSGRLSKVEGDATTNNPTGKYAKDIKYRAFGAIKQMDYDLPNEVSQIKMEFDNRLRIDHSEVTSPSETGGYLLKADYEYSADSRIKAKDDLIRDQLDQTSKFDFAGRLVFNQFPMVENNESLNVRLYEQTIVYDAFSMMTSRQGEHWGTWIGFTETYLNGRIQNRPGMVYDASGNITKTSSTYSPHDFQETEFDAAGRRVEFLSSVKARWGSLLNMVTEKKTVHEYDGNGRPVKEEEGFQFYHAVNDPPPQNPPSTSVTAFQVWSSVLGQRLTKLVPDGSKWQTYITPGDAAIAIDDVQTGVLSWKTADPVTGTSAAFNYSSGGAGRNVKEYEPLGQEVSVEDPAELPDPPPNESVSHWMDMEWQCNLPLGWYGAFVSTPVHCMIPIAQSRFYVSSVGKPAPRSFGNGYSSTSSSFAASRLAYALPGYREDDGWYGRDAAWNDWDDDVTYQETPLTEAEIDILRKRLKDISADEKCKNYVTSVLQYLQDNFGSKVGFDTTDINEVFEQVIGNKDNDIFWANYMDLHFSNPKHWGAASGGFKFKSSPNEGKPLFRRIGLDTMNFGKKFGIFENQDLAHFKVTSTMATLIHELIHGYSNGSGLYPFEHDEMNEAARAVADKLNKTTDNNKTLSQNIYDFCYRGLNGKRKKK